MFGIHWDDDWKPDMTIRQLLLNIYNGLQNPYLDCKCLYDTDKLKWQYINDRASYDETAREWTLRNAI